VQVVFGTISSCIQYIRGGMLRALAVTTATRSDVLPDVPTLAEFVPGYEASQWYGVGAPKDTPAEVIDKLNKEINAVAADPLIKARLASSGVDPMSMTSAAFGKFIADETEKWGNVIQALNIKAD
jgi:tripartite-type tricarboxylate transporter receptor subunit TctC